MQTATFLVRSDENIESSQRFVLKSGRPIAKGLSECSIRRRATPIFERQLDGMYEYIMNDSFNDSLRGIHYLTNNEYVHFLGVPSRVGWCFHYAYSVLFNELPSRTFNFQDEEWFNLHFLPVETPLFGDLVVYGDGTVEGACHWGLAAESGDDPIIESRWGVGAVYLHPLMYVPSGYGNTAKFFRLKDVQ